MAKNSNGSMDRSAFIFKPEDPVCDPGELEIEDSLGGFISCVILVERDLDNCVNDDRGWILAYSIGDSVPSAIPSSRVHARRIFSC